MPCLLGLAACTEPSAWASPCLMATTCQGCCTSVLLLTTFQNTAKHWLSATQHGEGANGLKAVLKLGVLMWCIQPLCSSGERGMEPREWEWFIL